MPDRPDIAWDDALQAWVLWRYEDARAVLEDDAFSATSSRAPPERGQQSAVESPETAAAHLGFRRIARQVLTERGPWIRERMRARMDERLDAVLPAEELELVGAVVAPWCADIALDLVGAEEANRATLRAWIAEAFLIASSDARGDELRDRADKATARITAHLFPLVGTRRRAPGPDVLSALATATGHDDDIPDHQVAAFAVQLLVGLCDSVPFLLGNALYGLFAGRRPEALTRDATEELLRWGSPAGVVFRLATAPRRLGGVDISPGDRIALRLAAANRDPRRFRDPDDLHLARPARPNLTFGAGRHRCVGAPVVREACAVAVEALLVRLPAVAVVEEGVEYGGSEAVGGVSALPVRPVQ